MDNTNIPLWGVVGLSDEEQRQVRGGVGQKSERANCIRGAVQNYVNTVRNNPSARASARVTMINNINNCNSGGCA